MSLWVQVFVCLCTYCICVRVCVSARVCVCLRAHKRLKAETDSDVSSDSETKGEKGSLAQSLDEGQAKKKDVRLYLCVVYINVGIHIDMCQGACHRVPSCIILVTTSETSLLEGG